MPDLFGSKKCFCGIGGGGDCIFEFRQSRNSMLHFCVFCVVYVGTDGYPSKLTRTDNMITQQKVFLGWVSCGDFEGSACVRLQYFIFEWHFSNFASLLLNKRIRISVRPHAFKQNAFFTLSNGIFSR